ncbi:M56 family metallopeptidase, partial [Pedobacter sp.]|uniref:M56 family metallopeptidase n=1 Tax=Pedobacter sp. TaxID=1411316 RepID=UPI003D7FD8E8
MNWAHYLLQANIYLVVFYAFYKLLLDKETYFILNRIYLMAAGILSFSLPFIKVKWFSEQTVVQPVYESASHLNQLIAEATTLPDETVMSPGQLIALVYLGGLLFFLLKFIFQLLKVKKLLKVTTAGAAFSFFNRTVIDPNLQGVDTIQHHEDVHSQQYHSVDVLFIELMGIINWFNPIIYLYKHSLKSIHEYLADEQAVQFMGDKEQYALLLVSKALGVPASSLTNSFFNKPLLKKRIFMLYKRKSTKTALLKYGLFVPLFGLALMLSSATISENEKLKALSEQIPLDKPLALVGELSPLQDGWKDFYTHLSSTIALPNLSNGKWLNGSTNVRFTIKDGNVENIGIVGKPIGSGADAAVIQQVLAYKKFDTSKNGNYVLTVAFKDSQNSTSKVEEVSLKGYTRLEPITIVEDSKVYDFVSIDKQPSFPGGMAKFYEYLKQSIKYPAEAKANNVNGKVFLSFIV